MSRRSLRLIQKSEIQSEATKSDEEIREEIRRDLEAIRAKNLAENPNAYDEFKETSEYLDALPETPKIKPVKGNLKKYLTERKKREKFLLSSAGPKSVPPKAKPAESLPTPRSKVVKSLNFAPTKTPQRKSTRAERKRSPIRNQGGLPPKSPFRFNPTRTESPMRRVNFGTADDKKLFVFGKNEAEKKENEAPKTPVRRQPRKTTYKHVVGNYNVKNCKYEKMSARDRRMAYSAQVDKRNLRKKGVKEITKRGKPDKKAAFAKKREGIVESLRKI